MGKMMIKMKFFRECIENKNRKEFYWMKRKGKIKLDMTANPIQPEINWNEVIKFSTEELRKYPNNSELYELKREIARDHKIDTNSIMVTTGADDAIEIILLHLLNPKDKIGIHIPTFPRFLIVAKQLCDADVITFKNINDIPESKVVVLCTPNNPTTKEISRGDLIKLLEENQNKMFVIDCVFSDFGRFDPTSMIKKFDNLIVIKSTSKIGIAGVRVGFIISKRKNIRSLREGISPFSVSLVNQKIAFEAIKDKEHMKKSLNFLKKEWSFIKRKMPEAERETNVPFFLVKTRQDSATVCRKLLSRGIQVANGEDFIGLGNNWIRVSIGSREENEEFVKNFKIINCD